MNKYYQQMLYSDTLSDQMIVRQYFVLGAKVVVDYITPGVLFFCAWIYGAIKFSLPVSQITIGHLVQ